jgi:hypothetical protein
MRTDEERLSFIEKFQLSVTWHDDVATIFWRGRASPGQPGGYHEISKGKTLAEATDAAIERYIRKHGITTGEHPESSHGVRWLQVPGWVG